METLNDLPIRLFESSCQWEKWLESHHAEPQGAWLKIAKKASGMQSVSYSEALELALCYGWIDGQKQSYDEQYFLQKFTPRRPKSIWSRINVEKVALLTASGKMKPSGLLAVEVAKQNGRWDLAYDSHRTITVPPDFQAALDQNPQAKEFFATLNKTNKYAILWRIQTARNPKARLGRIQKLLEMLKEGKKIHP